jgi:protein SCO1/2
MSKKRLFYILFFTAIAVGFFFVMSALIPGYAKERFPPVAYVQPFRFTNQNGESVTEKIMQGKVVAVNFFFTTCKSVCPKMNNNLKPSYEAFKNERDFLILSHTSDPEIDTVAVLKRYADSMQVNGAKWQFLTGRKDSLYRAARLSYSLDDPNNNVASVEDDFLHTQFIALVNRKGEVVKIYDGLKAAEVAEMKEDIRKLLNE